MEPLIRSSLCKHIKHQIGTLAYRNGHCPDPPSGFAQPPQMMTMTDTVAVGIVIVNGPLGSVAQISSSEDTDIAFALIYGFDILYRNAPATAKLVFVVENPACFTVTRSDACCRSCTWSAQFYRS
jgi:hypothetical protein